MGGVDKHDWLFGKYSVGIRKKKLYWSLFTVLDMMIVNAWTIYKFVHEYVRDQEACRIQKTRPCIIYERIRSQGGN